MTDFMDMLKPTLDAINNSATSAYREGYAAGRREAKMELRRVVLAVDDKLPAIEWAQAVIQAVREWWT